MKSFQRFKARTNILGTTMSERALRQGIINYEMYLKKAGNQIKIQITDVGEPYVTEKTKIVACTMRDVKFNDEKNFDQKVITIPADTNAGVGSYVMWDGRNYLIIYEQHKEIPTHKTYVIRYCNSYFHCYNEQGNVIEIPMSSHNLTLYSNGLRNGKFLDYENSKRKVLISNNYLTRSNIEVGQRVFFSKYNTFKITSIDDFSTEGLLEMMFEQTLNSAEDDSVTQITSQQKKMEEKLNPVKKPEEPKTENSIMGNSTLKVGMNGEYELINTNLKDVDWCVDKNILKAISITPNGLKCTVSTTSNGLLVGKTFVLQAISQGSIIAKKEIQIASLF